MNSIAPSDDAGADNPTVQDSGTDLNAAPDLPGDEDNLEPTVAEGEESIIDPWDPTKSKFDTRTMTIDLLVKRMKEGEIDRAPEFQRRGNLWSVVQKSRLIESLLVRIPLPA